VQIVHEKRTPRIGHSSHTSHEMPSCTLSRPEVGEADVVSMLRRFRSEESESSRDEVVLALPVHESENITKRQPTDTKSTGGASRCSDSGSGGAEPSIRRGVCS